MRGSHYINESRTACTVVVLNNLQLALKYRRTIYDVRFFLRGGLIMSSHSIKHTFFLSCCLLVSTDFSSNCDV